MNYMVMVIVAIMIVCVLLGYFKGLVGEIISIIALLLGILGMAILAVVVGNALDHEFGGAIMAALFLLVYIVLVQLIKVILKGINFLTKLPIINGLNKSLGTLFGVLQGLIIIWVLFIVISKYNISDMNKEWIDMIRENKYTEILYKYNVLSIFFADKLPF